MIGLILTAATLSATAFSGPDVVAPTMAGAPAAYHCTVVARGPRESAVAISVRLDEAGGLVEGGVSVVPATIQSERKMVQLRDMPLLTVYYDLPLSGGLGQPLGLRVSALAASDHSDLKQADVSIALDGVADWTTQLQHRAGVQRWVSFSSPPMVVKATHDAATPHAATLLGGARTAEVTLSSRDGKLLVRSSSDLTELNFRDQLFEQARGELNDVRRRYRGCQKLSGGDSRDLAVNW